MTRACRLAIAATACSAFVVPALVVPTLPDWRAETWSALLAGWLFLVITVGTVPAVSAVGYLRRARAPGAGAVVVLVCGVVPPLVMLAYLLRNPADQVGVVFAFVPPYQVALLVFSWLVAASIDPPPERREPVA